MDIMEFLTVFFAGIIPVNTIKDAVLLGVDVGLNQWVACGAAVLGTLIPLPFFLFVLNALDNRARMLKDRESEPEEDEERKNGENSRRRRISFGLKDAILFLFSAVPVPFTGIWTSSILSVILRVPFAKAAAIIAAGTVVSGAAVTVMITAF